MANKAKKSWSDLTPGQQKMLLVAAAAEAVMTTLAAKDLASRPAAAVRGPKLLWRLGLAVQPFGPIAYLLLGRRS